MYMYLGYSLKSHLVSRPINSDKAKESTAGSNQKSLKYYYSFCYSTVHIKSTTGNQSCSAISLQSSSIMFFFIFMSICFRNRIAISSDSSCARCQANASGQHKRGKVDSNAPPTACAVHLVCPTAGCSSSRAK